MDPINALGLKAKIPSVTMPICTIEEYAISFLISVCASAINDAQTIANTLSTDMYGANKVLASGKV